MTAPLCRWCGGPIAKYTETRWLETDHRYANRGGHIHVSELPRTKAECQRLVNEEVVSVRKGAESGKISRFSTWDGKSYVDQFFCNGYHARKFGYHIAREGRCMPAYNEAMRKRSTA